MKSFALFVLIAFIALPVASQDRERGWSYKQQGRWLDTQASMKGGTAASDCFIDQTTRREAILNGNRITAQILNFGSISSPGNTLTDIVWNGLGYGYEFGPFVAAEVIDIGHKDPKSVLKRDENGQQVFDDQGNPVWVMHIVSDGIVSNGAEVSPDLSERWGWQPIPCAQPVGNFDGIEVVEATSDQIPTSDAEDKDLDGKPDSWPDSWFNPNLKEYVWPGALQQGASNADKEALYFMNDYSNKEFHYYPFNGDSTKKGLGLETEVRLYQWANPLAEDAIFLVYKISNKSDKDLDKVTFGMWGDPHVGGPGDWQDDRAFFDEQRNMVFAWDDNQISDVPGRTPGYFGYKFLESPGLGNERINGVFYAGDGIDNDNDGMIDESWTDGIDNDNDWNADRDDLGIDGIPGTGDPGEGDGIPTAGDQYDITKPGEPNFEFTDIDESDMIGLTSFSSPFFSGSNIRDDERVWDWVTPGRFDEVQPDPGDYVFLYGSGSFPLRAGETKRFSIALLVGENLSDLRLNAETVQQIFDVGYRFARPPDKPILRAVPGDEKVTLYWENRAELSVDPLSRNRDFEGYAIYRSTDHEFSDRQTITDINGSKFLFQPLTNEVGVEAKFDLENGLKGPSPIVFPQRGVSFDLGDDTGLFHSYVDTDVTNGQTYYYAVTAYDRGYAPGQDGQFANGIPPSETAKTITYNPVTDSYIFDTNTKRVVPRPRTAGYVSPSIEAAGGLQRSSGYGTGDITVRILDESAVKDGAQYALSFEKIPDVRYSVEDMNTIQTQIKAVVGKTSSLGFQNIRSDSFVLSTENGAILEQPVDYILNPLSGSVQVLSPTITDGDILNATFRYFPILRSNLMALEESNPIFDGIQLFVDDKQLEIDTEQTGWSTGGKSVEYEVAIARAGPGRIAQPNDYEVVFDDEMVSTGFSNNIPLPFTVTNLTQANQQIDVFATDLNRDGAWSIDEPIIFLDIVNGAMTASWQITFVDNGSELRTGDVFYIQTHKPFNSDDLFTFGTVSASTDAELAKEELRDIYVVPNPYVATNELEPRNPVSRSERGDRRLYFANIPPQCTIRIYSLAGELVDTIIHDSSLDDGKVFWDLRTKDNMNIAYGLYIYHVDSVEGKFIGKFAVIK
ncbi:MAG: hypothetical protein HOC28_01765 [Bacteroidetes Order II. Incertae sedis bacterium]|nr:hypothetical protein [Bacteroidetes Order II. bacterium]MBT4601839.1 hypothetical protein [Bacteroidetes Order II. bacterium]MBT5249878.1 hypothetical protein [Bacteroidetes Order II. bacterium]MBT6423693.1 hypothetical protein [Bacteroidetes Order II. bacterium]